MKGLLIKDIKLMKQQKLTWILFLAITVFLSFTNSNAVFLITYLTTLASTLATGSITVDSQNNGMAFLFTLPSSRKDYVKSKYIFAALFTAINWLFISVYTLVFNLVKNKPIDILEHVVVCLIIFGFMLWYLSFFIPVGIKYGAEKSRVVLFIAIGIVFLTAFIVTQIGKMLGITAQQVNEFIDNLNAYVMGVVFVLLTSFIVFISYSISMKVINKKEY